MLESDITAAKAIKPKGKAALKNAAKAKKRAKGMDSDEDEDSEEDFKPTKAKAKPKARPSPAKAKAKASPAKAAKKEPGGDVAMKDGSITAFLSKVPAKRAARCVGLTNA